MPFSANCPSCGAPVVFKSAASFHAVCEFCRSTLVRHGGNLENLGRMAELLDDASPVRLGTEGVYKGVHFAVIGRLQLRYAAGLWNEWHLLFDDMRSGWLSDAGGEYTVSFLTPPRAAVPAFDELVADRRHDLAGREFAVSNFEKALCIAGEGELPFAFGAGYEAPMADLRATDGSGAFATIDYSESPPLFFVGETLPFASFKFANLRSEAPGAKPAGKVKALSCPSCGGAIAIHDKAIQSVACPSCLTILDVANDSLKILREVEQTLRITPQIALGSIGRFRGKEWTLIGFQQRAVDPWPPWSEYLLHHAEEGLRWLVQSDGHWNWVEPVSKPPRYTLGIPTVTHDGTQYARFASGEATTTYVIGEFNWKVAVGETWMTLDFVAPPAMLSRESKQNEVSWSRGEYLAAEDVAAAFGLKQPLPEPSGIGANQPNPRREGHQAVCARFWKMLLLATVMQAAWFLLSGTTLFDERLAYSPGRDEPIATKPFRLDKPARTLTLRNDTDLDNNWVGLNVTLVEKQSGLIWATSNELSYWRGFDGGESWSEGSRSQELVFRDLPAGEYYLVIDPELDSNRPVTVADRVRLVRDAQAWSNFFLLLVFLAVFPLLTRIRMFSFESARWSQADFQSNGQLRLVGDDEGDSGGDD